MNNNVFEILSEGLVSKSDGVRVPEDEPVFILRARDSKASGTIRCYQALFTPVSRDWQTIQTVLNDFNKFRQKFTEEMINPEDLY